MGGNRRYSDDAKWDARILQMVARGKEPETLSPVELELSEEPITRPPRAIPVSAWVRYGGIPMRVDAEATAWTSRAVAIVWRTPEGLHRAWVWRSAVGEL